VIVPVRHSSTVGVNQAFLPMHWGEEYLSGSGGGIAGAGAAGASGTATTGGTVAARLRGTPRPAGVAYGVNALTSPACDPQSKQPELKYAAVKIEPAGLNWHWVAVAYLSADTVLATQHALQAYFRHLPYASCVPFGRADDPRGCGLAWQAAAHAAPPAELLAAVEAHFGLAAAAPDVMSYHDSRRGTARRLRIESGTLRAFCLSGDTAAAGWLRDYLERGEPVAAISRALLAPGAAPPHARAPRGKTVCQCLGVAETAIVAWLAQHPHEGGAGGARLSGLQAALKCGTQCGSCLPELRRMIAHSPAPSTP
jgi:assimilatory nitrate reductase catalytic subunit